MKILFIENKHKTSFWERIAHELESSGHEIYWIVQNSYFKPRVGQSFVISLPKKNQLRYDPYFVELESKDRYCYIYNNKPEHYKYYSDAIEDIITELEPNVVFGESTLFHELLAIEICKYKNIKYLNPSTCRYPTGRFSFYQYDTQEPYLGSNEVWSSSEINTQILSINDRKSKPDYMKKHKSWSRAKYIFRRFKSLVISWYTSEVIREFYNTPTVKQKRKVESERRKHFQEYEDISLAELAPSLKNCLVFPLQMQPESNLDVWGYPYKSQDKLVKKLVDSLGEDWSILIKPNPKSKYEINKELLNVIHENSNVIALSHSFDMKELMDRFDVYFSVTGTINHECILSNRICFSPVLPITKSFSPETAKIPELFDMSLLQVDRSVECLEYLISTSYKGLIGDEVHSPQVLSESNIKEVVFAFKDVLQEIQKQ